MQLTYFETRRKVRTLAPVSHVKWSNQGVDELLTTLFQSLPNALGTTGPERALVARCSAVAVTVAAAAAVLSADADFAYSRELVEVLVP